MGNFNGHPSSILQFIHHPHLHMYHYPPGLLSVVDLWSIVPPSKLVFVPQNFAP
jgi:hypothetical protein